MLLLISSFSWQSFLGYNADAFHIVMQDGFTLNIAYNAVGPIKLAGPRWH